MKKELGFLQQEQLVLRLLRDYPKTEQEMYTGRSYRSLLLLLVEMTAQALVPHLQTCDLPEYPVSLTLYGMSGKAREKFTQMFEEYFAVDVATRDTAKCHVTVWIHPVLNVMDVSIDCDDRNIRRLYRLKKDKLMWVAKRKG